jgi:hypothetical protein
VFRFIQVSDFFLGSHAVLQFELLIYAVVQRFHNGLHVVLKVLEGFALDVEFETLVIVTRNYDPVL